MSIAAAPRLTLQTLDTIRHFEARNLFFWLDNVLRRELSRDCGLGPRAAARLHRPALLEPKLGQERS